MIYVNVDKGAIDGYKQMSVQVDNTTINLGLVPKDVIRQVLTDLIENATTALKEV